MASLPPGERRQIAETAVAEALPLMGSPSQADVVKADGILRHAVHSGAWAVDVVQAAIDHSKEAT